MPRPWSRRDMLKAAGLAAGAAFATPALSACGVGGTTEHPNGANAVTAAQATRSPRNFGKMMPLDDAPT